MQDLKILLVEDSEDIQVMVKAAIGKKFSLTCVPSAEAAEIALAYQTFSLLILDITLPGEDGLKFCAHLRTNEAYQNIPVVFLTGKNQTRDKVLAFSLGADDYIVKPFDIFEFQARIEAKIRRLEKNKSDQNYFTKGPFRVALAEQKIYLTTENSSPQDLGLSTIEFKLMYYLIRHEEHVLSREQILNEVWGAGINVTDRAVDTCVYTLRKKLGLYGDVVRSVPRIGYKLSLSETIKVA